MENGAESTSVPPADQVSCKVQDQINLFRLAIDEVVDSVENAEQCLLNTNTTTASYHIVEKELSGQIDSLVKCWEQLKILLSNDQQQLFTFGKEFRSVRRTSQNTLQCVGDRICREPARPTPTNTNTTVVHSSLPAPKLPALKIPVFDGNLANWSSFWDIYDSLIHSRTDLADVVKFATLRNYLSDRAFKSIEGLAVTNANYSVAIQTIKDCFHKSDKLLSKLLRDFDDLPVPRHTHDELLDFKLTYEKLLAQINHLEQQDITARFFREVLIKKLPAETFKILVNKYHTYQFTVKQISEGLANIVELMEMCKEQPKSDRRNETFVNNVVAVDKKSDKVPKHSYSLSKQNASNNSAFTGTKLKTLPMHSAAQNVNAAANKLCLFCNQSHSSKFCNQYPSFESRRERVRNLNLCFCCLKKGHRVNDCNQKFECRNCNGNNHHTFLCIKLCNDIVNPTRHSAPNPNTKFVGNIPINATPSKPSMLVDRFKLSNENVTPVNSSDTTSASVGVSGTSIEPPRELFPLPKQFSTHCAIASSFSVTALATATTQLAGGGSRNYTRAFFDSGAQKSFIQTELAEKLELPVIDEISLSLSSFGNEPVNVICNVVRVVVRLGRSRVSIHAVVYDKVNTVIKTPGLSNVVNFLKQSGIKLADQFLDSDDVTDIGLVIGADYYHKFIVNSSKCAGINVLTCAAGAIIFGPLPTWATPSACSSNSVSLQHVICARASVTFESNLPELDNLWKLDAIGIVDELFSPEERTAIERFESSIIMENNQYLVDLPFKSEVKPPVNYRKAYGQLLSLMRSFQNKPELFDQYNQIFIDYEARNFIERVEGPVRGHYLPHHGVTKDSVTTPLRIVFNASSKQSPYEPSLNDCLLTGPSLTTKLFDYLLSFRTNPYAVVSDISKAFLRIGINEPSRDYCRFLWCPDLDLQQLITYRFKVVMFGATSSPFLLQKTLAHHLEQHSHPLAKQLLPHFYVDNFCRTYPHVHLISEEYPIVNKILLDANMPLQSWISNSPLFNSQIDVSTDQDINVLGLNWNVEFDHLSVKHNHNVNRNEWELEVLTKRKIVSIVSSVFDPLGLVSPLWIKSKVFIQDLWQGKYSWDTPLPEKTCLEFQRLCQSLQLVSSVHFPRFVVIPGDCQLHVFADASKQAYGIAAFAVTPSSSNLLLSKARVAPTPELTIPKLELTALNMGSKLARNLMSNNSLGFTSCVLWTDSEVTLHWVYGNNSTETYVRNRVKEISQVGYQIKHVPSNDNPADLVTKGVTPTQLQNSSLWMHGPPWLLSGQYPPQKQFEPLVINELLVEPTVIEPVLPCLEVSKYSSFFRVLRIMTRVIQFCKSTLSVDKAIFHLDPLLILVRMEQQAHYQSVVNYLQTGTYTNVSSDIIVFVNQLGLYLDRSGIICSTGRIQNASLLTSTLHPVLLPPKSHLTKLLVLFIHIENHHVSASAVLVSLRQVFWLPKGRQVVKDIVKRCVHCRKICGATASLPAAPPLPPERVTFTRPFACIGVDFTGAFNVFDVDGDTLKTVQNRAYVCLFTCTSTRAIHLELLHTLTTAEFLLSLRRFCAYHSVPKLIISDNGTNFVGCNNFLHQIKNEPEVLSHLDKRRIQWKFNTPRSPWSGGFFERLIGVVKGSLSKALYKRKVSFDELQTLLCEIQALVNNRPLTYVSESRDEECLTPNRLLYGRNIVIAPPLNELVDDEIPYKENIDLRLQYSRLSSVLRKYETIWCNDYLVSLRERHYSNASSKTVTSLKVDDIVLVNLDERHRSLWPLGKIIRLIQDRDGNIRSVEVLVNGSYYERSITKLVPVEVTNPERGELEKREMTNNAPLTVLPPVPIPPVPSRPRRKAADEAAQLRQQLMDNNQL